ncbi:MAG: helix-turn-helix domain-containing protein [Pseudomonadota bacterium]
MNTDNSFGPALKGMRESLGLSQLALAAKVSSTQRHISFLETGRSRITLDFLQRLVVELSLSTAQRGALFAASGFANPYPRRAMRSEEMTAALDVIERRVLSNWPFPAFALDEEWTVLRANRAAQRLFGGFGVTFQNAQTSLLTLVLSPAFQNAIINWEDASIGFYFRLQRAAARDRQVKQAFDKSKNEGLFDHIPAQITGGTETGALLPARMRLPDGTELQMTPLVGQLAAVQDVRLEQIEIEFMVPIDDVTEGFMRDLK